MNFRDKMRKPTAQQFVSKENNLNKISSTKNLYRDITNQLQSQTFEPGSFKRTEMIGQIGKRNSSRVQQAYEQQQYQPQIHYDRNCQRVHHQPSLINSNVNTNDGNFNNPLFQSKLNQTKGQINEQMVEMSKKMKKQIQGLKSLVQGALMRSAKDQNKNLALVVDQLNNTISDFSHKQKSLASHVNQNQSKMQTLQKQFNDFNFEIEQKLQKLMNSNSNVDIAASMKKSLSRNIANGDYNVQLKSSIKEIPLVNNTLVQQIRSQIHETQQAIRSIRLQYAQLRQQIKLKTTAPVLPQKPGMVQASKLAYLTQQINALKAQLLNLQTVSNKKLVQEGNLSGMNDNLGKVINTQVIPRVKRFDQITNPQTVQKQTENIKKQVIKQLESMPIIRVRTSTQQQKQKLRKMKTLPKQQQEMYMMDENNYILDCFGHYLLDENNQRVKLVEQQIYYLEHVEGIQIKLAS